MDDQERNRYKFAAGIAYSRAANLCQNTAADAVKSSAAKKELGQGTTDEDRNRQMLSIPVASLRAFAAELFLKAIYFKENGVSHRDSGGRYIHRLIDIFNDLENSTRDELIKQMECDELEFKEKLTSHSDDFAKWRYLEFESNEQYQTDFMYRFVRILESSASP